MTEQLAEESPPTRVQLANGKKVPEALLLKLTVPVGVRGVPTSLSVTVARHIVGALTGMGLGVQLTTVMVDRFVAVRAKSPELLK